jgi:hypothetical protein
MDHLSPERPCPFGGARCHAHKPTGAGVARQTLPRNCMTRSPRPALRRGRKEGGDGFEAENGGDDASPCFNRLSPVSRQRLAGERGFKPQIGSARRPTIAGRTRTSRSVRGPNAKPCKRRGAAGRRRPPDDPPNRVYRPPPRFERDVLAFHQQSSPDFRTVRPLPSISRGNVLVVTTYDLRRSLCAVAAGMSRENPDRPAGLPNLLQSSAASSSLSPVNFVIASRNRRYVQI